MNKETIEEKGIKFRKLLERLNKIAELRPDTLDFDVILAISSDTDYGGCEILDEIDLDDNIKQLWLSATHY
jgi:hypothetical protein